MPLPLGEVPPQGAERALSVSFADSSPRGRAKWMRPRQHDKLQFEKGKLRRSFPKTKLNYTVGWLAASMILTNFSGTREAPPIRPPSMSGCASSS